MTAAEPPDAARPRLARGVRLRLDGARGGHVLLAPERVVAANPSAAAILERCDGTRELAAIARELAEAFGADRALIEADARRLLVDLRARRLVEW